MPGFDRTQLTVWAYLVRRMMFSRYRGSVLGMIWLGLQPLLMLAGFTFVFTQIFEPKWPVADGENGTLNFAVILFAGLLVYSLFSEVMLKSAQLIPAHAVFVKKINFNKTLIPVALVSEALIYTLVGFVILTLFMGLSGQPPGWTLLWLPLVLAPFFILMLGLSFILSASGDIGADIQQVLTPVVTLLLFLSPVLYPVSAIPEPARPFIYLNPISYVTEAIRDCLIFDRMPEMQGWLIYTLVSLIICGTGIVMYRRAAEGFADVL